MKCFRCNSYDFDYKGNVKGAPYVECYNCHQGYVIGKNLSIYPVETLGDASGSCVELLCHDCKAIRVINSAQTHLVHHYQFCNRCVDEARKLKEAGEISYTYPVGDKMSWNDFLTYDKSENNDITV